MTQETAGEFAYDLEVLEADTAVSLNFSLREGMKNRTYKGQDCIQSCIVFKGKFISMH